VLVVERGQSIALPLRARLGGGGFHATNLPPKLLYKPVQVSDLPLLLFHKVVGPTILSGQTLQAFLTEVVIHSCKRRALAVLANVRAIERMRPLTDAALEYLAPALAAEKMRVLLDR